MIHCKHPLAGGRCVCVCCVHSCVMNPEWKYDLVCFNGCVILAVTHSVRCPKHHFRTQYTSSRLGLLNIHYALCV